MYSNPARESIIFCKSMGIQFAGFFELPFNLRKLNSQFDHLVGRKNKKQDFVVQDSPSLIISSFLVVSPVSVLLYLSCEFLVVICVTAKGHKYVQAPRQCVLNFVICNSKPGQSEQNPTGGSWMEISELSESKIFLAPQA